MPEAAEIETLRRQIEPYLPARILTASVWGDRTVRAHDQALVTDLVGASFASVSRLGKWLFLHTDDERVLVIHLRMSGRLHLLPPDAPHEPHTHASFTLVTAQGPRQLRFVDPRTFGELRVVKSPTEAAPATPDVSEHLTLRHIPQSLLSSRRAIKAILLEQTLLVQGVGNYMADEVCHEAGVLPSRKAATLTVPEWQKILSSLPVCFGRTAELRGVALADEGWRDLFGVLGNGSEALRVHAREMCQTCGGQVLREDIAGRSAYSCARCQK